MVIVYLVTNLVNGKRYVGVTVGSLRARVRKHFYDAVKRPKPTRIGAAILKYGPDGLRFSIVMSGLQYEEALHHEMRLIALWKPEYNIAQGGRGLLGYRHTEASKAIMSRKNTGRPGYWKGKNLPAHVCKKISERNLKPERRENWKAFRAMGPKASARSVICLDDGNEFESSRAAGKHYGICNSTIVSVCKKSGKRKTAGGLVFRYAGDVSGRSDIPDAIRRAAKLSQVAGLHLRHRYGVKYAASP